MNRYLLMSAAAVLASTGAANAGVHSFTFGTSGGSPYCDGGTITTGFASGPLAAWVHTNDNCASGTSQGAGYLLRVKGLGKVWLMSDNYLAKNDSVYTEYLEYTFNKPLTAWTLWIGFSGITNFEGNSGEMLDVTAGTHGVKCRGTTSTAAMLAQLVAAHRR